MKPANNAPVYLCLYPKIAELCRAHGYAAAVHGSLARDCDVICIPWIELPRRPLEVVQAIVGRFAMRLTSEQRDKPHGRMAWTIHLLHGDVYFDLQFMPALAYDDTQRPEYEATG